MAKVVPIEIIATKILEIRGKRVMLDRDLAQLYGVATRRLNEQVRRNRERFPEDFMFQLSKEEVANLKSQFATSSWGGTRKLPYVFTEQGVAMLSSVLNSERAIKVNIQIMRAFVKLKELLLTHKDLAVKLEALERKYVNHDKKIKAIFDALQLKYQLKYSNEVIYYGTDKAYFFQSIKLPNDTLRTRLGNCIDFSALFASILEALGINSVIALIPGHAFVGWETWKESAKFQFLETTAIEKMSFEDAFSIGQKHMSKGTYAKNPTLYDFPGSPIFVQIKKMREKGIMPIIDF